MQKSGGSGWAGGGPVVGGVRVDVYEELKLLWKCKKEVGRGCPVGGSGWGVRSGGGGSGRLSTKN